jgi:hypothetical protein
MQPLPKTNVAQYKVTAVLISDPPRLAASTVVTNGMNVT